MGNFGYRNAYQIQTESLAANMNFTEWSLEVTEARIPGGCLTTPGCYCPVSGETRGGGGGEKASWGKTEKPLGFQMVHSRHIRKVRTTVFIFYLQPQNKLK